MTTTQNASPLSNLVTDAVRFGPAPTRTREIAVIVTTVALLALIFALVRPEIVYVAVAAAAVVATFAVRWALGTRKWGSR